MREIAFTTFGKNALSTGLTAHAAALLAGMVPVGGGQVFFGAVYGLSCLSFMLGVRAELKHRGFAPARSLLFYVSSLASVIPVMGPLVVMIALYAAQGNASREPFRVLGIAGAILRLKINPLVIFIIMTVLFVLFALTLQQHDPYFK